MTMNEAEHTLLSSRSVSLHLSDGAFGRPFDNQYTVTSAKFEQELAQIRLSDEIILSLFGRYRVEIDSPRNAIFKTLRFYGYDRLVIDRDGQTKEYDCGEVKLTLF